MHGLISYFYLNDIDYDLTLIEKYNKKETIEILKDITTKFFTNRFQ